MPSFIIFSFIGVFILGFLIGRITKKSTKNDTSPYTYLNTNNPLNNTFKMDPSINDSLLSLIKAGKKLEAIKVYRNHFQCSLKEAKDAIYAIS